MKKSILLIALLCVVFTSRAVAQEYTWALGVRGGVTATGLTGKYNFDASNSIEGIIDFTRGVNVYALYERNVPVIGQGFNFFYGAGANLGGWKEHGKYPFTMGVNGIVGLEYKFNSIPLLLAVDYKPCLNFVGRTGFHAADFGLSIKVAF